MNIGSEQFILLVVIAFAVINLFWDYFKLKKKQELFRMNSAKVEAEMADF